MERGLEKEEYRNGTPSPFSLSRFFRFPPASSHVDRDHYLGLIELIIKESAHSHHLPLALLVCLQLSRVVSRFLSAPHWALGNQSCGGGRGKDATVHSANHPKCIWFLLVVNQKINYNPFNANCCHTLIDSPRIVASVSVWFRRKERPRNDEERVFRFWPHQKWDKSQKMKREEMGEELYTSKCTSVRKLKS